MEAVLCGHKPQDDPDRAALTYNDAEGCTQYFCVAGMEVPRRTAS